MKRAASIGLTIALVAFLGRLAYTSETESDEEPATLEGMLKVHPKFLYKYYIAAYGGQTCALYGKGRARECPALKDIKPGTYIRVRGRLGTFLHKGGTKDNPSPFGRTWVIYMQVVEVEKLKEASG